jgi:hypothetical protein
MELVSIEDLHLIAATPDRLEQLEKEYREILEANDWVETPEAKDLRIEYFSDNFTKKCMECGSFANIDCQFH